MTFINRRAILTAASSTMLASCATTEAIEFQSANSLLVDLDRQPDLEIDLWPTGVPGDQGVSLNEKYVDRENIYGLRDRAAHEITRPTLSIFRAHQPNGSAILIIPGGGYKWVVVEKEGYEGARLFSNAGATVYVLKHRLPHQGWAAGPDTPLQDAQRACRMIRSRSLEDGVDPERIAVMGFSAGGHVAGSLANRFDVPVYSPVDNRDQYSARPNAVALIYPVATLKRPFTHKSTSENMLGENPSTADLDKYSLEMSVRSDTPPLFLLHAGDDLSVPVENSLDLYAAARTNSIPVAMHIFEEGGHGFGLRGIEGTPLKAWPEIYHQWLQSHQIIT